MPSWDIFENQPQAYRDSVLPPEITARVAVEAAAEFQTILDHRGEAPLSPLYALAQLGVARAAAMGGQGDKAREAYDTFLNLWRGADSPLPLLRARSSSSFPRARVCRSRPTATTATRSSSC